MAPKDAPKAARDERAIKTTSEAPPVGAGHATTGAPHTVAGLFVRPLARTEEDENTLVVAEAPTVTKSGVGTSPESPSARQAAGVIEDLLAFHAQVRGALDKLASVVGNAKNGVNDSDSARHLVELFEGPLLWHDEDEEVSILRRLRALPLTAMQASIVDATHRGHDKMETMLDELLAELRAIAKGAAAFDLASFEDSARALKALLEGHMTLEETNLFPLAVELLGAEELQRARAEVLARHGRPSADAVRARRAIPI